MCVFCLLLLALVLTFLAAERRARSCVFAVHFFVQSPGPMAINFQMPTVAHSTPMPAKTSSSHKRSEAVCAARKTYQLNNRRALTTSFRSRASVPMSTRFVRLIYDSHALELLTSSEPYHCQCQFVNLWNIINEEFLLELIRFVPRRKCNSKWFFFSIIIPLRGKAN